MFRTAYGLICLFFLCFLLDIFMKNLYNNFCALRTRIDAGVAELADALDLGSSALGVKVRVLSPAPIN